MKDTDSKLITEAYQKLLLEMEREKAVDALVQAAGEGREDLHDLADDIRNSMTHGEYIAVLNTINRLIPRDERTPGLNSILASGLPQEEPPAGDFPRDEEDLPPPEYQEPDGEVHKVGWKHDPNTQELEGEELINYIMNRFGYTREQAIASMGGEDESRPPRRLDEVLPMDWEQVFETLGFHEIEGIDEPVLELGPINGEFIRVSLDWVEDRLNLSVVGEEGPVSISELGMSTPKFIDLPGGPNSKYWQYILASFIVSFFIRHNHDPGDEMMGKLDSLTDS